MSLQVLGFSFPHPLTYEEMENEEKHGTRGMCGRKRVVQTTTHFGVLSHMQIWLLLNPKGEILNNQASLDFTICKSDIK